MKKERSNKAIYARFAITILVCAALGGVAGFCAAMAGKNLLDSADSLNMALASLGQLWFIPGYVLLLVSTIYYLRGKALLPQAEADDDAFQESDRRLCLSLILSGIKKGDTAAAAIDAGGKLVVKCAMFAIPLLFIVIGYLVYRKNFKIDETLYSQIIADLRQRGDLRDTEEK